METDEHKKKKQPNKQPVSAYTVNDGLGSLDPDVDKNAIRLSHES